MAAAIEIPVGVGKKRSLADVIGEEDVPLPSLAAPSSSSFATGGDAEPKPFTEPKKMITKPDAIPAIYVTVLENRGKLDKDGYITGLSVMVDEPCALLPADATRSDEEVTTSDAVPKRVPVWTRTGPDNQWLACHIWQESLGQAKDTTYLHYEFDPPAVLRPGQRIEVGVKEITDSCQPLDRMILRNLVVRDGTWKPDANKKASAAAAATAEQPVAETAAVRKVRGGGGPPPRRE
jgi:hypothetical protein